MTDMIISHDTDTAPTAIQLLADRLRAARAASPTSPWRMMDADPAQYQRLRAEAARRAQASSPHLLDPEFCKRFMAQSGVVEGRDDAGGDDAEIGQERKMVGAAVRDPKAPLTAAEAAARLSITTAQLMRFVTSGDLKFINIGQGKKRPRYRFDPADLDAFKTARTMEHQPCPSHHSEIRAILLVRLPNRTSSVFRLYALHVSQRGGTV